MLKIDNLEINLDDQTSCNNSVQQLKLEPSKRIWAMIPCHAHLLSLNTTCMNSSAISFQILSMFQHAYTIWIRHSVSLL